jgi:hypothetical protein
MGGGRCLPRCATPAVCSACDEFQQTTSQRANHGPLFGIGWLPASPCLPAASRPGSPRALCCLPLGPCLPPRSTSQCPRRCTAAPPHHAAPPARALGQRAHVPGSAQQAKALAARAAEVLWTQVLRALRTQQCEQTHPRTCVCASAHVCVCVCVCMCVLGEFVNSTLHCVSL